MSEALYTHYAMSSDGELTVLGYAYGEPWVEQALYMDDMRYPTPEAAKAAWEAFLEVTKADVRTPSPELVKQMQGKDLWIGNEAFAKCMEGKMLELVKEGDKWVIKGGPPKRADMEVVVRCKDCEYYVKPSRFGYCDRHSAGVRVTQRDYCSWGERRKGKGC